MRRAILVPVKYGMAALMLALEEAKIKVEYILVYMHQRHTATKHMKDQGEITILMLHAGHINKNTTLFIPTEKEWSQYTAEYYGLRYIKIILSGTEYTSIDPE